MVLLGALLGWASANALSVGIVVTFVVWAVVVLGVGATACGRRSAVVNGALFGFTLGSVFAIFAYTGTDPIGHALDDARAGGAAAGASIVLAWIGAAIRSSRLTSEQH